MENFDAVVIGAGPGGYVASIRLAQLGKTVALIEKENLGGVCLNWGCIPTKALLRTAEVKHLIDHAKNFGLEITGEVKVNLEDVVQRSRKIAGQLSSGIKSLLQKNKVKVINGIGKIESSKKDLKVISVTGEQNLNISAKNVILATGATAKTIPNLAEHNLIWYAKQAMIPSFIPKNLLIIGSGAIGIEFASFYNSIGSKVSVVEMQPRILPQEDFEISDFAKKHLEKMGINFCINSVTENITPKDKQVDVGIKKNDGSVEKCSFDAVIVAIGVVGNTKNLGLESTKIKIEKGQIKVDQFCETEEEGIFAIGDVVEAPWLAHKASHEGILVAEKIAGLKDLHPVDRKKIPSCTYSMPQIASIGLTEDKAKSLGIDLKIGRFPYKANGKAIALGEPEGMIKTIFNAKTGELLGVHMVGSEVTELIQGLAIAINLETTEQELMQTIFPHPTLSEMIHESVLNAYGRTIHF